MMVAIVFSIAARRLLIDPILVDPVICKITNTPDEE
jgi:hypothetical protein